MPKKLLHLVRHGAGQHDETHDYNIHDPILTPNGASQVSALRDLLSTNDLFTHLDLVASSPLRRCIQTSLIAFSPYFTSNIPPHESKKNQSLLLLPRSQESSSEPSNTGSSIPEIRSFFADQPVALDFSLCDKYPDFNYKHGLFAPTVPALEERAKELRVLLKGMKEAQIAVVTHGDFLHHVTGMITKDGNQAGGDWANAEWRCYEFVENVEEGEGNGAVDGEARIVETEWSWKRRGAEGPSLAAGSREWEVKGMDRGW